MFVKLKEKLKKLDGEEDNKSDNIKNMDEIIQKNPNIKELIEKLTKQANSQY